MSTTDVMEISLAEVGRSLNAAAAERLLDLRAPTAMQERVDELASLCNEGSASSEELAEYDSLINTSNLIAILQIHARKALDDRPIE